MMVVVGSLGAASGPEGLVPDGLAARVAMAGAAEGIPVQLVTRVGDDPAGDHVLQVLARSGVGHVATLRDASRATPTRELRDEAVDPAPDEESARALEAADAGGAVLELEGADVALALRYIPDITLIACVHVGADVVAESVAAASWSGAEVVVVLRPGDRSAPPGQAGLVVEASDPVPDPLADALGRYAAAIHRGDAPTDAYAAFLTAAGHATE